MGPIVLPSDLIPQFRGGAPAKPDAKQISAGIQMFVRGLAKKLILSDTLAAAVTWGFDSENVLSGPDVWIVMLCLMFETYFDFSGYCDMATGVSRMLNIKLPINFDSPYWSTSIREFWRRWHITLTKFLTKYVYIPLGGSRCGTVRTYLNILFVFLVSGLWHGAGLTYILWALLHGLCCMWDRAADGFRKKIPAPILWLCTFLAVCLFRMLFRSDSVTQWAGMVGTLFSGGAVSEGLLESLEFTELTFLLERLPFTVSIGAVTAAVFLIVSALICWAAPANNYHWRYRSTGWNMVLTTALFFWCLLFLGSESVFIYNGF